MTELAAIHEFGAPQANIPERSFIRRTFVKKQRELSSMTRRLATAWVTRKIELKQALDVLGLWGASKVRDTITQGAGVPPRLEDSTIARKGSSRPLVDTGRLVGSIQHDVVMNKIGGVDA